jgi:hypothetical protein
MCCKFESLIHEITDITCRSRMLVHVLSVVFVFVSFSLFLEDMSSFKKFRLSYSNFQLFPLRSAFTCMIYCVDLYKSCPFTL